MSRYEHALLYTIMGGKCEHEHAGLLYESGRE